MGNERGPDVFGAGTANSLPCTLKPATLFPNKRRDFCVVLLCQNSFQLFWGRGAVSTLTHQSDNITDITLISTHGASLSPKLHSDKPPKGFKNSSLQRERHFRGYILFFGVFLPTPPRENPHVQMETGSMSCQNARNRLL